MSEIKKGAASTPKPADETEADVEKLAKNAKNNKRGKIPAIK